MDSAQLIEAKKRELINAAISVRANSYSPISHFPVGAAVLTKNGEIFSGANVENASLPCGWCAEISAVAAAVSKGHRHLIACAVSSKSDKSISPCGLCRQTLSEFSTPETPLFLISGGGDVEEVQLGTLLPRSFGLNNLTNQ